MQSTGSMIRLARLFSEDRNAVVIAVDHGLYFGALPGMGNLSQVLQPLDRADAILMAPAMATHCQEIFQLRGAPAMLLRLNWASNYLSIWEYTHSASVPMISIEDAVAQGADLVLCSLTLRNPEEAEDAENVRLFSHYVSEKRKFGIPLVGEVFPTGGDETNPEDMHEVIAVGCRLVSELGADLIKTFYTGSRFEEITGSVPIPILALGSKKTPRELDALMLAAEAIRSGARGVVFGRNVLQAQEPERFLNALIDVVKLGADPEEIVLKYHLN